MWGCFTSVLRYEGPLGLYKGLVPQLVGQVPEKAIRLFIVDRVRNLSPTDGVSYPIEVLAGLAAGANQVLITNPAEIIKVRMQVQGHELAKKKAEGGAQQAPLPFPVSISSHTTRTHTRTHARDAHVAYGSYRSTQTSFEHAARAGLCGNVQGSVSLFPPGCAILRLSLGGGGGAGGGAGAGGGVPSNGIAFCPCRDLFWKLCVDEGGAKDGK